MVLEVVKELLDEDRLILRIGDIHAFRRGFQEFVGYRLGALYRLDDVCADPLLDFDGDRGLAVDPGDRLGILERRAHGGEIPHPHDCVGHRHHGEVGHVLRGLDQGGDLDRVLAFLALQRAGRDKAVGGANSLYELVEPQPV